MPERSIRVEMARRSLFVNDGDAARISPAGFHAIERGRIVCSVETRRHDDDPLDMQRAMQRRHLLG